MWMVVVAALALAVAIAVASALETSDLLRTEILIVLRDVEAPAALRGFGIAPGPPNEVARGMALAVQVLPLGGIPAAIMGAALAARQRKRPPQWSSVAGSISFGGFVFQLCSVMSTAFLLLLLFVTAAEYVVVFGGGFLVDGGVFAKGLSLVLAWNLWGLLSWRALQLHGCDVQNGLILHTRN